MFLKLKDYLLVSVCDPELCDDSLNILHNFMTIDQIKYTVYDETRELFVKSLELLYSGDNDYCKEAFLQYLVQLVVPRTEDSDNALKKFFKSVISKLEAEHSAVFSSSNISGIIDSLN